MEPSRSERQSYGEYDVEGLLGKGSIGKVYLARHRRLGRRVALKIIRPEQRFDDDSERIEFQRRLQREAELCAALHHPNVVTLFEAGYENEVIAFLATEYIDGESLQARLKRTRPLPLEEALRIGADVLRALAYAHSKGVIHRDIKPGNILIASTGEAKIADFGIARPIDSSLTSTNSLLGTPNYMSPEQVKSTAITPRADLFSAGVVMYEMLTGLKPFAAPEISGILYNVVNLQPSAVEKLNPAVPRAVGRIVSKLMAKSPAERYGTAAEALKDLERAHPSAALPADVGTVARSNTADTTTPLHPIPELEAPTEVPLYRRRVSPAAFWLITLALAGALTGSVLWLRSRVQAETPSVTITKDELARSEAKRRELASARAFAAAKQYEEAVRRYDAYVAKYPNSAVAVAERQAAQQHLVVDVPIDSEMTVTKSRVARAKSPPPKPPSRWERVKHFFRGQ